MTAVIQDEKTFWVEFGGREIGLELTMLTVERAKDLLANYNRYNRKISDPDVLRIARDMRDGLWVFTGEPIIIGEEGDMHDGQHRCKGVVDSGVPIPVLIVYNVSAEAMAAIDQGKPRTVRDILKTSGPTRGEDLPYDTTISAAAKLLMEGNRSLWKHADNRQRIALFVQGHSTSLIETAAWAKGIHAAAPVSELSRRGGGKSREPKCIAPGTVAALTLVMEERGGDREAVREFFEKIVGKTRCANDVEHSSFTVVRRYLVVNSPLNRGAAKFGGLMELFETLIVAYNRVKVGAPIRKVMPPRTSVRYFDELPKVNR
jgi:hypothetical protein